MVSQTLTLPQLGEQRMILPGRYSWQEFKTFETNLSHFPGVRLSYLDGIIELMTLSPEHETLKCILGILLATFFVANDISFTPTGSATLEKASQSRVEPDLSYFFEPQSELPNLTIEIALSSGGISKLERYKYLQIPEVWFWENQQFVLYHWRGDTYEPIEKSELFPTLDFNLLAECLRITDRKEAIKRFRYAIEAAKS
jgi:Uma2 family endonuclease